MKQLAGLYDPPLYNWQDKKGSWKGWCQAGARVQFGAPAVWLSDGTYDTATKAWNRTKYKHRDRNFPRGLAVPIWFGWGTDGHVAVSLGDGRIRTTSFFNNGFDIYGSLDALMRAMPSLRFEGWSEDINGVKVVDLTGAPPKNPVESKQKEDDMSVQVVIPEQGDGTRFLWNRETCVITAIHDTADFATLVKVYPNVRRVANSAELSSLNEQMKKVIEKRVKSGDRTVYYYGRVLRGRESFAGIPASKVIEGGQLD